MSADFIPDTQFVPDQAKPAASAHGADFVPDQDFQSDEDKHGGLLEQAKTFGEGALESGTLGFGSGLEADLLDNAAEQRGRRAANPGSFAAGQITGVVAPALVGDEAGVAGAAGKLAGGAGEAVAAATGLGAEGAGLASRLGAAGVKSAIEGAIFQGGDEVSKMLISDPNQTAQTAAASVGMGGLLGGVLGGGLGATGELWSATIGKKVGSALDAAGSAIEGGPQVTGHMPDVASSLGRSDLGEAVGNLKPNVGEIDSAAERLGISPTEGTRSADKFVQNVEAESSKNSTIAGRAFDKERVAMHDGLKRNVDTLLEDQTNLTESQVGRQIKEGVKSQLESELKPIEGEFDALKPHFKAAQISDELKEQAVQDLLKHDYVQADEGMKNLADKLSDKIKGIKNVDELKTQRTFLNAKKDEAFRAGAPEAQLYKEATDALTRLRTSALEQASASGAIPEAVAGRIQSNDALYASYKKNLQQLGVEGGLGRVGSARQLLDKFGKMSDEAFATKFFDLNDVNQLNYFQQEFPKEFEMARRYKLREIAEKSASEAQGANGSLDVHKFLSQISDKKMNPEARNVLFNGAGQKVQDIRTVYQAIPGTINPSGTGAANILSRLLTPGGLADNLSDAAKYALVKAQPFLNEVAEAAGGGKAGDLAALQVARMAGSDANPSALKQMGVYIAKTLKGETAVTKATKAVFDAGRVVIPSTEIDANEREKLDKKLKDLQANNEAMFNSGQGVAHYMPDHGTAIAQTAMNGVNYLNSLRPNTTPHGILDNAIVPSKASKAAFNRALDIANKPLLTLQATKDGTLTTSDMKHLIKLYPDLYKGLQTRLHANMVDTLSKGNKIPYRTRIGLATFQGMPLDSTMTGPAIIAAQPKNVATQSDATANRVTQSTRGSMKALKHVSMNEMTPDQARQARLLK